MDPGAGDPLGQATRGACSDAVLYNFDAQYAIEYEYSEKDPKRYLEIFERYRQEKYEAALYILRTEARIEKLWKKIHSAPKKIYFISEERLFVEREKAVFRSFFGNLPVAHLLHYSFKEATLDDLRIKYLRELVIGDPEAWKQRKPFILFPKTGSSTSQDGDGDSQEDLPEESGGPSIYPSIYPPMYPDEDREDENEF